MADEKNDIGAVIKKIVLSVVIVAAGVSIFRYFNPGSYAGSFFRFLFLYITLLLILTVFRKNNVARFFLKILWIPAITIITFYPFLLAILSVVLSYGIAYLIAKIIFEVIPPDLFHYQLTKAAIVYFEITISSLVVAYFYDKVIGIWDYIFFTRSSDEHRKLSMKIMNQSRAKFSIYFFYFIAMLILNTTRLNGHPVIESVMLEKAVLESFATFLAFERIISNWKFFIDEKTQQ